MAGQSRWGAAGWPRLAGAWGSRHALALGERFGGASWSQPEPGCSHPALPSPQADEDLPSLPLPLALPLPLTPSPIQAEEDLANDAAVRGVNNGMSSAYDSVFHVPEGSMTEEEIDRKVNLAPSRNPNSNPDPSDRNLNPNPQPRPNRHPHPNRSACAPRARAASRSSARRSMQRSRRSRPR